MSAISRSLVITSFAGSVVVITHDCWFLDRLATHITAFESDGYVHVCEGNFEVYERSRRERLGLEADEPHRFRYKKLTQKSRLPEGALRSLLLGVGRPGCAGPPPSEPCWRISRTRLSGRWFYLREDGTAVAWVVVRLNSPCSAKRRLGHRW
jgi:hypothetical protein